MLRHVLDRIQIASMLPMQVHGEFKEVTDQSKAVKWKRLFDVTAVSLIALFILPLLLVSVVALLTLQGRPIFIRHRRIGQAGKQFGCLKFRTMVINNDEILQRLLHENPQARAEWKSTFKLKDDPRVTPLGRALRKSSLDELPQLWNILKGDMSLVGPRPIIMDEVHRYGLNIADYCRVKPGLTGLWQVSGRSDTDYATRIMLDVEYVRTLSFIRDLKIILLTVPAVVQSRGSY